MNIHEAMVHNKECVSDDPGQQKSFNCDNNLLGNAKYT